VGAEEVGAAATATIASARVLGVEALERSRDALAGDREDRVVVRPHQRVGEHGELVALADRCQALEEVLPIVVTGEEEAEVAAVGGEMEETLRVGARFAGHPGEARAARCERGLREEISAQFRHSSVTADT
jgi:hypothetical protein